MCNKEHYISTIVTLRRWGFLEPLKQTEAGVLPIDKELVWETPERAGLVSIVC